MTHAALRPVILSLFALSACGPMSVMPAPGDGSSPDAAASDGATPVPMGCEVPRTLFGDAARPIERVVVARAGRGYAVAASSPDRVVSLRVFDEAFDQVGEELTIRSERAAGMFDWPVLSLRFQGEKGALGYDASVHELAMDDAMRVRVVRSVTPTQGADRLSVLGVWLRTEPMFPAWISAITRDGSVWNVLESGLQRAASGHSIARFSDPVSMHFSDRGSAYLSIETRARRDVNNQVEIRRFITGHGVLLQSNSRTEEGTSVSAAVRAGEDLVRLHFRSGEGAMPRSQLTLVRHDPETGATRGASVLSEDLYASSGAIGVAGDDANVSSALLVWTSLARGASAETLVYQWGPSATPSSVAAVAERSIVVGALVDSDGTRGWPVWASFTGAPGAPQARVFTRCVRR